MANSLTVNHEVLLTKQDSALLRKTPKTKRATTGYVLREPLIERLVSRGLLHEEKEAMVAHVSNLGELMESEMQSDHLETQTSSTRSPPSPK